MHLQSQISNYLVYPILKSPTFKPPFLSCVDHGLPAMDGMMLTMTILQNLQEIVEASATQPWEMHASNIFRSLPIQHQLHSHGKQQSALNCGSDSLLYPNIPTPDTRYQNRTNTLQSSTSSKLAKNWQHSMKIAKSNIRTRHLKHLNLS